MGDGVRISRRLGINRGVSKKPGKRRHFKMKTLVLICELYHGCYLSEIAIAKKLGINREAVDRVLLAYKSPMKMRRGVKRIRKSKV